MKGIITEIQRFSLRDGPGIRTVVFLKGCNMACQWCHNPETISPKPQLAFYAENCIGCGKCETSPDLCFADAKVIIGKEMSSTEIYDQIARDLPYYKNSGGGVTLSGGEALMQPEFAIEILGLCKEAGIHGAIETNLSFDWEEIEPVLAACDLVMADIKHMNDSVHVERTGVSNKKILANIAKLDGTGKKFIVKTPVIPGVNDNERDIEDIALFLSKLKNLECFELLNFNPLGAKKREGLKVSNPFKGALPLSDDRMEKLAEAARAHGVKVRRS
ncbi:MAG: glycyl-radical enzyme activating protein [Clostridiales bacterium]|nr:glycyl-radical enzyme activating protein [Clostridiales bacterium]